MRYTVIESGIELQEPEGQAIGVEVKCNVFQIREYFLQAEEVLWNYVPYGYNRISNKNFSTPNELTMTKNSPTNIGSKYIKSILR